MADEIVPEVIDFGTKRKKEKKDKKVKKEKADDAPVSEDVGVQVKTVFEQGVVYPYLDMLQRVHAIMNEQNTCLDVREKYVIKPPKVDRLGSRKTSWGNFPEICEMMKRPPNHLADYIHAELGCVGTFAGDGQLILKGKYAAKRIESLLKKYIKEYVTCAMCRSANTTLERDPATRLHVVKCQACGAERSSAAIKTGFHAQAKGERARARIAQGHFQVRG